MLLNFDEQYLFYTPFQNDILKDIFKNCSKSGNGIGIPDRIYFDKTTLIIFECKSNNLIKAEKDIFHYINGIKMNSIKNGIKNIYGVAFVNKTTYKIFKFVNNDFEVLDNLIELKTFNLQKMELDINILIKKIHKIHNYIRDNTKISNEDKGFFMAIILISLNKKSFRNFIKNYNKKEFIYDYLKENPLEFDIDPSVFEFLKKDYTSNKHFYNLIKMVLDIYSLNPNLDLLNLFYNEFIKYSNTDSKSLGIVLTPDYIVELMVYLLNINENDVILDLCSGTGSFLLESLKYNPKKIIACEIQKKLFTLLKCNLILRNIKREKYELKFNDCFNEDFKATKSIINPPFGMKDKKELDFVIKQIKSVKNGLVCAIFPISCVSNNKKNINLKKKIMEMSTIKTIINLNNKIFYPNASVECCIILLDTSKPHNEKDKVLFIDYKNDETQIITHKGKIKSSNFRKTLNNIKNIISKKQNKDEMNNLYRYTNIELNDEWNFIFYKPNNFKINKHELKLYNLEYNYMQEKYILMKNENMNNESLNESNLIKYKIKDMFNITKPTNPVSSFFALKNVENGYIPFVSAVKNNNGINCFIKNLGSEYKLNEGYCLSLVCAGDGGSGYCFFRNVPFYASSSILILNFKNEFEEYKYNIYINLYFAKLLSNLKYKYSFGRHITIKLLEEETFEIPMLEDENKINIKYIEKLFN